MAGETHKALTIGGELPEGALVDGVHHRTFTLRTPTVRDNIDAVDLVGTTNGVAVAAAVLSLQLIELGSLKLEQITFDLVAGLHPQDFNVLEGAAAELEKKRRAALLAATPNGLPSASRSGAPA